jgi:polyprenyl P-hydroxybenzoate/phenylacrylic acid decarboxylase-like protein
MRRILTALTGASGAIYGIRSLEELRRNPDIETHLILSRWAEETILSETHYSLAQVKGLSDVVYEEDDMAAAVSSGSFPVSAMLIVPASMKTAAAIAHGLADNLINRAADVCLKEGRRLILVPRETPLNLIHLQNLTNLAMAGALILPPIPGFYAKPRTIEDIVNHTVGKILDQLAIEHSLFRRWPPQSSPENPEDPPRQ